MKVNDFKLVENLKKDINPGTIPMVNAEEDFFLRDESINSWFIVGHYQSEGHTLDCLFHLMTMRLSEEQFVINANFSLTDETTGEYYSDDRIYPITDAEIKREGDVLTVKCPNGSLIGTLDRAVWKAEMPQGSMEIEVESMGYPIWNAGGGLFASPFDKPFHQYSIPCQNTNGRLVLNGKEYKIENGQSWFDRQWQQHGKLFMASKWRWSWMNLNLDNGDVVSLWDMLNFTTGLDQAWGTIQHPDGSQSTVKMELLKKDERDFWRSDKSNQNYPTRWTIRFPEIDAELDILPVVKESEIVSQMPFLNKYEGASKISGTWKGQPIGGFCFVELLGDWTD